MTQASAGQPLARPYLGIRFETDRPTVQKANSLPVAQGAWIPSAADASGTGGPRRRRAALPTQGGLQAGDIITAVDGTTLDATHPLDIVTSQSTPGRR